MTGHKKPYCSPLDLPLPDAESHLFNQRSSNKISDLILSSTDYKGSHSHQIYKLIHLEDSLISPCSDCRAFL